MTDPGFEVPDKAPGDAEMDLDEDTPAAPESAEYDADAVLEELLEAEPESGDRTPDEAQQYLEDLQRVTAEFANYRRQAEKRNSEASERAAISIVEVLLPVLDACDQAAGHGSTDVDPIRSLLMQSLEREGLERFNQTGGIFDPTHHEAVMREDPDDGDDPTAEPVVTEVMRAGYSFGGVVVRAAMVKVRG
jgi:molecular chaperone GrpE